ncbi:MAG: hypothetical protein KF841_12110 [Phycisphaerae bacterium]|nr:hypothetical protein [Phycisphaerae bacterium]
MGLMQREHSKDAEQSHENAAADPSPGAQGVTRVAVLLPSDSSAREAFQDHVARLFSMQARVFHPKDQAELNDELKKGGFDHVVFESQQDLLAMIWNGHGDIGDWCKRGVKIGVCRSGRSSAESLTSAAPREVSRVELIEVAECFERWSVARRRRQVIVATILSVIAIAALAVLLTVKPV